MVDGDENVRILVPAAALGSGVRIDEVRAGLAQKPHAIALDAGSTDSGPAYLATGQSKYSRQSVKRDLEILMSARDDAGIPLLIGTCGTSGCDLALNWTLDIVLDIAREKNMSPRIALLYSEQDKDTLKEKMRDGKIDALAPAFPIDEATIDACNHIVALLGPEAYITALEAGADIILGGRTTDTAVLAAVPLMRGAAAGAAWHAAKTAECGGLCTLNPTSPGVLMSVDTEGFTIEPLSPENQCTPESVWAHMLYENSDPFLLVEPGGVLEVSSAVYTALDERRVRVTGSRWLPMPYTMKLEGASGGPFQTIMLIGIADPLVLIDIDTFLGRMQAALKGRLARTLGDQAKEVGISLRPYGWNAVGGGTVAADTKPPREIGLLFVATAPTQALATEVAKICNPYFFHFPVKDGKELPSYAFPFSPAEIERGQVFEFRLNHIVHTAEPLELVRIGWAQL